MGKSLVLSSLSDTSTPEESKSGRDLPSHPGTRMPSGSEPEEVDVAIFYVQTGDLQALSAPKEISCSLCEALDTVQWTEACSALLDIRRLALHHPDDLIEVLDLVLPMIIKHMNSLRSSLCKTALICVADLFKYCGDLMAVKIQEGALIETLLSKAAMEKKFVMDEARRTLDAMIQTISTEDALHVMLFHVQSTNCKVRAVVAVCVADIVDRAFVEKQESAEHCAGLSMTKLLQTAAQLVNDKHPNARESARRIMTRLRGSYEDCEHTESWLQFAEHVLGKSTVVKMTRFM